MVKVTTSVATVGLCIGIWSLLAGIAHARANPGTEAPLVRLDGGAVREDHGGMATCLWSGTYDANAWDKNLDPGVADPLKQQFHVIGPVSDPSSAVEIMQWSWAERARCQKSLGTASAITTGAFGLLFVAAEVRQSFHPTSFSTEDKTNLAILALIPGMMDDVRAVGPERRYYTSAVLGTSLMATRNNNLLTLADHLDKINIDLVTPEQCTIPNVKGLSLSDKEVSGISTLQAKLIVDINAYQDWCRSFATMEAQVTVLKDQNDVNRIIFQSQRLDTWKRYANAVNTGGYDQLATTSSVLGKVLALPFTAVSNILSGKPSDFKLGNSRPTMSLTDAADLPVLPGNYSVAKPSGDLTTMGVSIAADYRALAAAMKDYHAPKPAEPAKKKKGAAAAKPAPIVDKGAQDMLILAAIDPAHAAYFQEAVDLSKINDNVQTWAASITTLNNERYLLLDLNAGDAYLGTQSAADIMKSSPKAVTATTTTAAGT